MKGVKGVREGKGRARICELCGRVDGNGIYESVHGLSVL